MRKYLFVIVSFAGFFVNNLAYSDAEPHDTSKTLYVIIKENNSIWNSTAIKVTRLIGTLGFRLCGCACLWGAVWALAYQRQIPIFASDLVSASLLFAVAEIIKVKNNKVSVEEEKKENNYFIVLQ